jgi:hypothetical protein
MSHRAVPELGRHGGRRGRGFSEGGHTLTLQLTGALRRSILLVAALAAAAVLAVGFASPAGAYGGGANHDMWQVGFSMNCNNPSLPLCADLGTGGDWGWVEFDRSADGTQTWGDAQTTFCFHTVGGGGAGAGHTTIDITSWTISDTGTFVVSGEETDSFRGMTETSTLTNEDSGIPSKPGHYTASDILGFSAPGVAIQIQVSFRPAK